MVELGETSEWTLLTGAGFTANWGAPVAQEVWASLISDPGVRSDRLLMYDLLHGDGFDFEMVLDQAQRGLYSDFGAKALRNAIQKVYDSIEENVFLDAFHVGLVDLNMFFARFFSKGKTGCIFTLNQDMLLERLLEFGHGSPVRRPCIDKPVHKSAVSAYNLSRLNAGDPSEKVIVPDLITPPLSGWPDLRGSQSYLKLHGSWDWRLPDGSEAMVLGGGKQAAIDKTPLLRFYFDVFQAFINGGNKRLLTLGYGFHDQHINEAIARAVSESGLQVFIWDITPPRTMYSFLNTPGREAIIWNSLCGYIQKPLHSVFPRNMESMQMLSDSGRAAITTIFGDAR